MRTLTVRSDRLSGRSAPMTWGQLTQQAIYDFTAEESHRQTQHRSVDLPPGVPAERIATALRTVLERHESLRSLFQGDGQQLVQPAFELTVPMAGEESAELARLIRTDLYQRSFGPGEHHPPANRGTTDVGVRRR